MAALMIAIFPQNSSRGNREEQQDRTDPNSRFELARKPAWLLAFRQFGLPKWKHDFESFSLRPLRYISKYIFMANLRFVYRKSALKLGTVAVRILLENASFRQVPKPVRTSKLTFSRVIWRHPAKHPLGFRVVLVTTTSIHLHIHSYIIIAKSRRSVNTFCRRDPQRQRKLLVRDERKPLPPSVGWGTHLFLSASGHLFHAVLSFPRARL